MSRVPDTMKPCNSGSSGFITEDRAGHRSAPACAARGVRATPRQFVESAPIGKKFNLVARLQLTDLMSIPAAGPIFIDS
jgi:hypothetical protein